LSFSTEKFVSDCISASSQPESAKLVRELLKEAVSNVDEVMTVLGSSQQGEIQKLHVSDSLTVLNVIWAPRMTLMPHNHNMWAVIGVYAGREDNIFWRRIKGAAGGQIEAAGAKSLGCGDVQPLGCDIIHSVTNPTASFTRAIHVYGGDFFAAARSEWDPDQLKEHDYDVEKNMRLFSEANQS
jgi:predicted metal-dependent enzyme (double-stranded beta helix superfamily)